MFWMVFGLLFIVTVIVLARQGAKPTIQVRSGGYGGYRVLGTDDYAFDIVGEQAYQSNLAAIAGPKEEDSKHHFCKAQVVAEPTNSYDLNAVVVKMQSRVVGYFDKVTAKKFQKYLLDNNLPQTTIFEVDGLINGGWLNEDDEGSYGVKLDAPLYFKDWKLSKT